MSVLTSMVFTISVSSLLNFVILYGGYYYCPFPVPNSNDFSEKLKYALRCIFPVVLFLQATIANVGIKRAGSKAGNPLSGNDHLVVKEKNFLANTLEQLVIYVGLNMVLITYLQSSEMKIIPFYAVLFIVGRILFIAGYPKRRGYGMFMHFVSTAFFGFLIIYLMFSRGFMYDISFDAADVSSKSGKTEL